MFIKKTGIYPNIITGSEIFSESPLFDSITEIAKLTALTEISEINLVRTIEHDNITEERDIEIINKFIPIRKNTRDNDEPNPETFFNSKTDFKINFEYLQKCIFGILDHIAELEDDDEIDEYCYELGELSEIILANIPLYYGIYPCMYGLREFLTLKDDIEINRFSNMLLDLRNCTKIN